MTFTPIMFARHTLGEDTGTNRVNRHLDACVIDLGGSEAMPFLMSELGLDVTRLTTKGMGLRSNFASGVLCVYYFAENAFRLVLENEKPDALLKTLGAAHERFDISEVVRSDLVISSVEGEKAFDSLVDDFKLTPGLRIADSALCYCAQSGDAFITVQSEQGQARYQLIAKPQDEEKWQQHLQSAGFEIRFARAA